MSEIMSLEEAERLLLEVDRDCPMCGVKDRGVHASTCGVFQVQALARAVIGLHQRQALAQARLAWAVSKLDQVGASGAVSFTLGMVRTLAECRAVSLGCRILDEAAEIAGSSSASSSLRLFEVRRSSWMAGHRNGYSSGWNDLRDGLSRNDMREAEENFAMWLVAFVEGRDVEALSAGVPAPVKSVPPSTFGGRRRGQACECGNGTLEATRHEGVAFTGWTIDCTACVAGYDEEGRHYCPVCEEYRDGWQGGTDADPRPWCGKCGNPQPGWKEVKRV